MTGNQIRGGISCSRDHWTAAERVTVDRWRIRRNRFTAAYEDSEPRSASCQWWTLLVLTTLVAASASSSSSS